MSEVFRGNVRGQEFEIWTDEHGRDQGNFPGHPVNDQVAKSEDQQQQPKSVGTDWRKLSKQFGGVSNVDR